MDRIDYHCHKECMNILNTKRIPEDRSLNRAWNFGLSKMNDPIQIVRRGATTFSLAIILISGATSTLDASPTVTQTELDNREVRVRNSEELRRAVKLAQSGTTILLEPGTYRGGLTCAGLQGTADRPIVIAGADPKNLPIIDGGISCLHLTDPAHVELRNLVLTGARTNGLNIDDGGSYDTPAHHVLLNGLHIQQNGSDGNHDGIKLSGVDNFRIKNCTVERWGKKGSGIDMVGCQRGVVSACRFLKGDKIFGNAVQMKGGSREITVSHCRFDDAGGRGINIGGSTGLPYFRPKPQGYEAKDITVSDCIFIGSIAPIAFVGVDTATVQHNTFYRPTKWLIRILQENQSSEFVPCRNGVFSNNIIVFRDDELSSTANIGSGKEPQSFKFATNFWLCINRPENTQLAVKLPTPDRESMYGQDPKFGNAEQGDFRLGSDSPAKDFGPRRNKSN